LFDIQLLIPAYCWIYLFWCPMKTINCVRCFWLINIIFVGNMR
jgi:hypothetical protein